MNLAPLSFWDVGSKLHVAPLEISPHFWTEGGLLSGDSCLFSLWKQDWFLHIIVFVLSWLQAFQHLVHLLLCLRSKCQARSPLWEGWKSWSFYPIKPEQLSDLVPNLLPIVWQQNLNLVINAVSLWLLVVVTGFHTGKYHWWTKALEVSGIWLW